MAWTTPRIWVTSELVTAALLNTHLKDNMIALRPDVCVVNRTVAQTIANNTETSMLWDGEQSDPQGMHSLVTNTDRINILRDGIYLVSATVIFTAHATGFDYVYVNRSGVADRSQEIKEANSSIDNAFNFSYLTKLSTGDYLTLDVKQTSGGNLDMMFMSTNLPTFSVCMVYDLSV